MTTQDVESVKKEIAEVSAFVKEKVEPLREERDRLQKSITDLVATERDIKRSQILSESAGETTKVKSGPYEGQDALDLAISRSLFASARLNGGTQGLGTWEANLKAAMDSVIAGTGDELVSSSEANLLWRDVNLETRVASLFSRIEMPTNPFDIPLEVGDVSWFPGSENVSSKSTALTTGRQTLTAHELVAEVPWSLTLDEDAVVAMLPEVRRTLIRNAAEVIDDVVLNGDQTTTNNINADGATISATEAGKAEWLVGFDGLLHLPLVDNTSQANDLNGAVSAAAYNTGLRLLGKYGVRNNESVFVTDVNTFLASLAMEEVETVDKLGSAAIILSGQLGVIYGHPMVVSEQMVLSDTDGKVTDAGNGTNTGRILAVNRSQWRLGFRRTLMIETERDIQKRQNIMVVSMRLGFDERSGSRSTATHTALQYNVTGVA